MRMLIRPKLYLGSLALLAGCSPRADEGGRDADAAQSSVRSALDAYMVAARAVDADRMAASYTLDAMLFEPGIQPVRTRDSIRAFMASFPGVRVDTAEAVPDTIAVYGRTAYLWGSYYEVLTFPGQPVSSQRGKFVTEWRREPGGPWLIHRFFRVPLPSPRAGSAP
ncbi:MAG: YybH family protein [Gemmatimonadales bacterium]